MNGFAVIYRWQVEPDHEAYFRDRWRAGTLRLREEYGGLGSLLARDKEGAFVAIALWPSEAAREAAFAECGPVNPWPGAISFEETKLHVEDDLWKVSALRDAAGS